MFLKKSHLFLVYILLISPVHNAMGMNTVCEAIEDDNHSENIDTMLKMSGLYGSFRPKNLPKELYVDVLSFLYPASSIPRSLAYALLQSTPAAPDEIETPEDIKEMMSPNGKIKVTTIDARRGQNAKVIIQHNGSTVEHVVRRDSYVSEDWPKIDSIYFDCHSSMVTVNYANFVDDSQGFFYCNGIIYDIELGKKVMDLSDIPTLIFDYRKKLWFNRQGKIMISHASHAHPIHPLGTEQKALIDVPQNHPFKQLTEPQLLFTHLVAQHSTKYGKASLKRIAQENECDVALLQKTLHTFDDVTKLLLIRTYNIEDTVKKESRCKTLQNMCTIQ